MGYEQSHTGEQLKDFIRTLMFCLKQMNAKVRAAV